jgi:uridylate kinase
MVLDTVVLSLGGSILVPEDIDVAFLAGFRDLVLNMDRKRFIVICGGGRVCRKYQDAARGVGIASKSDLDWIGIRATRLNAELVRAVFGKSAYEHVVQDPDEKIETEKRVIVGAGFKPGSSTDLRAVQLAERMNAGRVINMSNIDHVYSGDPNKDPNARKLEALSWREFQELVGVEWVPGMNAPFDPIASREAQRAGIMVVIIGNSLENLDKVLRGEPFEGTTIR